MLYRKHHFHNHIVYYKSKLNNSENNLSNIKFLIHTLNRKLYQHMKDVKTCKLGRFLPYSRTNNLKNNEKQVVTIPKDLPLSDNERSVLNKGLNFIPLEKSFLHFTVRQHVEVFFRRLRLQTYHHNQPNIKPTLQDPFLQIKTEDYKWTPNPGQCKMLDKIIDQTRRELEPYFVPKSLKFSNISKEECMAISSLRKRQDIIIKPADKGGAVVVWRKDQYIFEAERQLSDTTAYTEVYQDPIEENQIEISHTVKTLIKNFLLPSTACKLIHPCPKTSNFYMLPKIHKENCPGRPIVSTYDCPTVYISKFLDIILSPLVQELPSFIKDTP